MKTYLHLRHLLGRAYGAGIRLHHRHTCVLHVCMLLLLLIYYVWMLMIHHVHMRLLIHHEGHVSCGHGSCKRRRHEHSLRLTLPLRVGRLVWHERHARITCLESYGVRRRSLEADALVRVRVLLLMCRVRNIHFTKVTRMRAGKIRG
jgi:hypothetical protein